MQYGVSATTAAGVALCHSAGLPATPPEPQPQPTPYLPPQFADWWQRLQNQSFAGQYVQSAHAAVKVHLLGLGVGRDVDARRAEISDDHSATPLFRQSYPALTGQPALGLAPTRSLTNALLRLYGASLH